MTDPRTYILESLKNGFCPSPEVTKLIACFGLLAPSTHNTQPWSLQLTSTSIVVLPNLERAIPVADPDNRYLYISCGTLIANMLAALEALKIKYSYDQNQSDKNFNAIITINLPKKLKLDPANTMINALLVRQNYRGFFLATSASVPFLPNLYNKKDIKLKVTEDRADINELARLTANGLQTAYSNPEFRREISVYINPNNSKRKIGLHGYSLRMTLLQSQIIPRLMKRINIGKKLAKINHKSFIKSSAVCLISIPKTIDGSNQWVEVGLLMERYMIFLNQQGWQTSIYVASLERNDEKNKVKEIFKIAKTDEPQILFTIGKAPDRLPESARLPLEAFLA